MSKEKKLFSGKISPIQKKKPKAEEINVKPEEKEKGEEEEEKKDKNRMSDARKTKK